MKKKNKAINKMVVDLSDRCNIKIIPSKKNVVTDTEIIEFEKKLATRYSSFYDFTALCIEKNIEKHKNITEEDFKRTIKNTINQNQLLKEMLKFYINEEEGQEN